MSRVEELPEQFDESLNLDPSNTAFESIPSLNIHPSTGSQSAPFPIAQCASSQNGIRPELPSQMASVRSHTADEIINMMNRTPLFMTSLENVEDEGT